MLFFALASITGIGILLSLAGWGALLVRVLRLPYANHVGFKAALGLALSTSIGGILNFRQVISPIVVRSFLALGMFLFLISVVRSATVLSERLSTVWNYFRMRQFVSAVAVAVLFVTAFKYATVVSPGQFHPQDDYHAYFVFPLKMLQTGSLGQDPFSERRLVSSLGGNAFLDTFPLSITGDVRTLSLMDQGTAFLILLLLMTEIMVRKRIPAHWIALMLLAVSAFPAPISNITAMYGGIVLLVLILYLLDQISGDIQWNQVPLLAIIFASVTSLKSTFAPVAAILFLTFFGLQLFRLPDKGKTVFRAIACASFITILLLPWMVDSYRSSGTLFYPVFGKGFHGSRYGIYLLPTAGMGLHNLLAFLNGIANTVGAVLAILACLAFLTPAQNRHDKIIQFAIILNLIVDVVVIGVATGGVQMYRYSFGILFAILLFLLVEQLVVFSSETSAPVQSPAHIAIILCFGMLLGAGWNGFAEEQKDRIASLKFAMTGQQIVSFSEVAAYKDMQNAIPSQQKVMIRLDKNFLLDFRRNPMYINDLPGGASLPPGVPIFKGPDALANYLVDHDIRYLAYSYSDEATFSKAKFSDRLQPDVNVWLRRGAEIAFDFQDNALALGRTRKKLFDDGNMFVLDLASPIGGNQPHAEQHPDSDHSIARITGSPQR